MNFRITREISKIDRKKWSEFVYDHPNGNIFRTPEMFEVYKNTKNYKPVFLAIVNEKDEILGTLLAVTQKEYSGILGNFTARSIIWGGPLIKNEDSKVLDIILKEYNQSIKGKAIYSQFRNLWGWNDEEKKIFEKNGYTYEEHLNIVVDLTKSQDELWKDVHSKRRNEIRRAKKEGVIFSVDTSLDALKRCYEIIEEVYSYAKLPCPSFTFFKALFENSEERIGLKLFTAKYKNNIIGCMLALVFKDIIYDFYAGSMKKFYNKYPNDLIPWEIFLWGKKNVYKIFDFGGAGKPNVPYGVRDYKLKFGGELVNFGRYEKVHKPFLMKIGKIGLKIWRKLK